MKRRITTRRWFLVGSVGFLAAWEPYPVSVNVVNASGEDVQVRFAGLAGHEAWVEAKAGADVHLGSFPYASLCSPPDRWLHESFTGLEIKLADGSVVEVSREAFEKEAEYHRRWIYRFRGRRS